MNRPPESLKPVTVSNPTSANPFGAVTVPTPSIDSPLRRIVIGGGADPSGVTRRPDTRTAGTGRSVIATSLRSSPAPSVICVAAPADVAAGKYVVR